ncbi:5394_t:CDS:2 [Entrophospora sp. SA101]|nr:5394_t:CDS:2 [Entrophospora sp. SA101]
MSTKPTVLVLGGLGFIGKNFIQYLVENELASEIRVVDKLLLETVPLNKKQKEAFGKVDVYQKDLVDPKYSRIEIKMDFAARNAVNLSVLKRHDEYIVEIIDTSSHVVVYLFDRDQSTWTKKGVEGTISIQPVFGFIVMNRLGLDNFMAPLVDNMDLEFKDEYIIYRTDDVANSVVIKYNLDARCYPWNLDL